MALTLAARSQFLSVDGETPRSAAASLMVRLSPKFCVSCSVVISKPWQTVSNSSNSNGRLISRQQPNSRATGDDLSALRQGRAGLGSRGLRVSGLRVRLGFWFFV